MWHRERLSLSSGRYWPLSAPAIMPDVELLLGCAAVSGAALLILGLLHACNLSVRKSKYPTLLSRWETSWCSWSVLEDRLRALELKVAKRTTPAMRKIHLFTPPLG